MQIAHHDSNQGLRSTVALSRRQRRVGAARSLPERPFTSILGSHEQAASDEHSGCRVIRGRSRPPLPNTLEFMVVGFLGYLVIEIQPTVLEAHTVVVEKRDQMVLPD